ncbi:twin-arginine translocase subunit TatB [Mesorhizobium sp. NBSH29]|uniref:Sec-independent protein translocase protein TatB n=1 Tax=Mesorhizobium sp. NBSH29 TaxID=2654249 RepID=UPI0018965B09|nr:Sec-independent protein translocase protein TatB [Mesorhizobium sp. NBSH29]QPC87562.1 twin-arginine translocase subunit TatB [Mesorhizobium sp. NBSH29]
MFDIGWTEMLVIAIVMIVVVGPKDLPRMLRTFGKTTAKLRGMAGDFQKQFNDALKEAELDELKQSVDDLRGLDPRNQIKKHLNPFEKAAADVRAGVDSAMKPSVANKPADPEAHTAEPLKTAATNLAGVSGPTSMPTEKPIFPAAEKATKVPAASVKSKAPAKPAKAKPAVKTAAKEPAARKTTAAPVKKAVAKKAKPAGSAT